MAAVGAARLGHVSTRSRFHGTLGPVPRRWGWRIIGLAVTVVGVTALVTGMIAGGAMLASRALSGADGPPVEAPPAGQFLHGVYPGGRSGWEDDITPASLDAYERAVGRSVAWVYFSNNWFDSRAFPAETAGWIRERGSVPFIRLMLRSRTPTQPDPRFKLRRVLDGTFDDDLRAWGEAAAGFGSPLIVEWGTEMNGDWFGWNGQWNGGGDQGPRRFRRAYRHIERVIEDAGADNITWAWHVNGDSEPDVAWNQPERYYPGDEWVDWVGLSAYGALTPTERAGDWRPFRQTLDEMVPRLTALAPGKPVMVFEFGMAAGNPDGRAFDYADWALTSLFDNRWPAVRGFSWWNETWQNDDNPAHDTDMRVQTNRGVRRVFRRHLIDNPAIVDHG